MRYVIVPAPAVQAVLETGVAAGLKSATVYAAQLGEGNDPEIVARGVALKSLIERSGLVMCGPNCMGFNALREKNFGYPNADLCALTPGSVAFVTQSGGTVQYIGSMGAHRGVNFNYLISSGNELSVDLADYVNFFAEDDGTRVIALFVEGIRRPQAFMAAATKALAAGKPIVAIKTGKSQKARDSAQSHTGAIAGDYGAFTAMCERYGIVVCPTLDDMIEMLLVFQAGRLPKGPRVGWVTTSGGTVDLLFDYLEEIGGIATPEFDAATKATLRPLVSHELELKNPLDAGNPVNDAHDAAVVRGDRRRSQCRHAGLGRHAALGIARARSGRDQEHRRRHRQAGDRIHPHGDPDRSGDGEIPERGRLPVPAGPAGGDPRARRARVLRRAHGTQHRAARGSGRPAGHAGRRGLRGGTRSARADVAAQRARPRRRKRPPRPRPRSAFRWR